MTCCRHRSFRHLVSTRSVATAAARPSRLRSHHVVRLHLRGCQSAKHLALGSSRITGPKPSTRIARRAPISNVTPRSGGVVDPYAMSPSLRRSSSMTARRHQQTSARGTALGRSSTTLRRPSCRRNIASRGAAGQQLDHVLRPPRASISPHGRPCEVPQLAHKLVRDACAPDTFWPRSHSRRRCSDRGGHFRPTIHAALTPRSPSELDRPAVGV